MLGPEQSTPVFNVHPMYPMYHVKYYFSGGVWIVQIMKTFVYEFFISILPLSCVIIVSRGFGIPLDTTTK